MRQINSMSAETHGLNALVSGEMRENWHDL